MKKPSSFDPGLFDPLNDAALLAGRAGVKKKNSQRNSNLSTQVTQPLASKNAPRRTFEVAAKSVVSLSYRTKILAVIKNAGAHGATDTEIELATGIRASSITTRRGELRKLGLIVDSGCRRRTPRGWPAAVWVARYALRLSSGGHHDPS